MLVCGVAAEQLPFTTFRSAHPYTQHDGEAAHARAGAAVCSACSFKLYYPCVAPVRPVLFVTHYEPYEPLCLVPGGTDHAAEQARGFHRGFEAWCLVTAQYLHCGNQHVWVLSIAVN